MERKLTYFWEEKKYEQSSTRLMSFFVFILAFYYNYRIMQLPGFKTDYWFVLMNLIYLIAIFTPKYLHKIAELKLKPTDTP